MVIVGAVAVFIAAPTGLDTAGIGQTYLAVGILLLIPLLVGLVVIGYVWLSQQTWPEPLAPRPITSSTSNVPW